MIGPSSSLLRPFDTVSVIHSVFTQLAIRVDPARVDELVKEISHKAMGCRTAIRNGYIVSETAEPLTQRIPDTFSSLIDAATFVADNHTVPLEKRCAIVCYNKDTIVLNSNHITADGRYLQWINEYLLGNEICPDPLWRVPESPHETFKDEVEKATLFTDNKILTMNTTRYDPSLGASKAHFETFEIPVKSLRNYKNGKCSKMTELIFNSTIMPASAYNGKFSLASTMACVNLRDYLIGEKASWKNTNTFCVKTVHSKGVTEESTLGEVGNGFRSYLNNIIKTREFINELKGNFNPSGPPPMTTGTEFSNVGELKIGGSIKDIHLGLALKFTPPYPGELQLTTYHVGDKFVGRLRYPPAVFTKAEVEKLSRQTQFVLTQTSDDMKVKDVVDELIKLD